MSLVLLGLIVFLIYRAETVIETRQASVPEQTIPESKPAPQSESLPSPPQTPVTVSAEDIAAGYVADPVLTPGEVRTTDRDLICKTRTRTVRNVSGSLKEMIRRRYKMKTKRDRWCNTEEGCEIDHNIPLAVGGANTILNLWPQPYDGLWNAHHKDQLEAKAKRLICSNRVTVEEAQGMFQGDWRIAYRKWIAPAPLASAGD
ncbi:MAG: HNH endonuclease [Verrucomicrobiaceae bacterium]|nr:MAG: HNH endonuclease [Verrucomicrobiaceae bacterium]